jgi:hypothetical protein
MRTVILQFVIAAVFLVFVRPATADLGAVHVFTRSQPEISDELEEQFLKRIADAHLHSRLGADHFHFFIRVDSWMKDGSYGISVGRAPYIDEIAISISGSLTGVENAIREIEMAFKQGTLYELKTARRKGPVKQPVLEDKKQRRRVPCGRGTTDSSRPE